MVWLHHSAAVHIPLAIAVLFPITQIMLLVLIQRKHLPVHTWILNWVICGIQIVALGIAYITGLRDLNLSSSSIELLNKHQQLADYFIVLWIGISILLPLSFRLQKKKWQVLCHFLLFGFLVGQFVLAIQLGQVGGLLVFGN